MSETKKITQTAKPNAKTKGAKEKRKTIAPEVSVVEVADFTRDLAAMIEEGTSLVRSLAAAQEKQSNPVFKRIMGEINDGVQRGETLSSEFARYPEVFDEHFVSTVRLGEVNGTLDLMLRGLSHSDEILTFDEALRFLGTSKPTLYRLLAQNTIKGLKVGRQWRFRKADLISHMERKPDSIPASALDDLDAEILFFAQLIGREDLLSTHGSMAEGEESSRGERQIIGLVNGILAHAIEAGASDVHIERRRQSTLCRIRIDGVLHEVRQMPQRLHQPLIHRFKVMADCNPDESQVPQDGRVFLKYKEKNFAALVNFCPAAHGESVVMRILDQSHALIEVENLGVSPEDEARLRNWMKRSYGLIVVAGPTGSGKTTTLYSLLNLKLTPDVKVMTIEDPVGYELPGATQVFVNRKVGLTFPVALRAFLRQDPDVIMCGKIEDLESLDLLHQAAGDGHQVLSSMPMGGTAQVVERIISMGLEPFMTTSVLTGVVSQSLVRRLCPDCREDTIIAPALLERAHRLAGEGGYMMPSKSTFYRGRGCDRCRQSGYRGRVALFELMEMNSALSEALLRRAAPEELTQIAVANGMKTIFAEGARKAIEGQTTLEEVFRVTASAS